MKIIGDKNTWLRLFNPIAAISDDIQITFNKKGAYGKIADKNHVSIVDIFQEAEEFESYNIDDEFDIVMDADDVIPFIKQAKKDEKVTLILKDERKYKVHIGELKRTFKIVKDTMKTPRFTEPNDLHNSIVVSHKDLKLGLTACENLMTDEFAITIHGIDNKTTIDATDTYDAVEVNLSEVAIREKIHQPSQSSFSIEYFKNIVKGLAFAKEIRILTGTNTLLKLEAVVGARGYAHYWMAPRMVDA